jgi:rhamnosyltransferase
MTNAVTPRVAVLLATHNGLPWLEAQVDSIFAQSGVEVTLLVSDDASDDGTDAWLVQRAATDSRLEILRHGHRFGSAAGNFFYLLREVDATRFDYYALADQDDLWRPDKLERAVAQMQVQRAEAPSGRRAGRG